MANESNPIEQHKDKLTYLLKIASIVVSMTAATWGIFFFSIQDWLGVFTESILVILGYMGYVQTKRNNTKIIAYMFLPILFAVMCFICLFFDLPNAHIPRSNNHYFLPMALYAYVLYQDENPYLRITVPVVISLAFLLFTCTNIGINLSEMTNEQRLARVWVTNSVALVMLYLVALIMHSDFKVRHTLELELSNALLKNELKLYFQPQVEQDGRTVGAEALTRWRHPSLGIVAPSIFIPLAEKPTLFFT